MSNQLLSKMFAMVAENAATGPLLAVLFAEEGDELLLLRVQARRCMRLVADYLRPRASRS